MTITLDAKKRFWKFVDKQSEDQCWNWVGGIKDTGRGNFYFNGKTIQAHRMSWVIHNGDIPENMQVLHHCDNGKCVNPSHLFLGTQYDNIHDMEQKRRSVHLKGNNDPKSKLTEDQVRKIRELYATRNYTQRHLAQMFGVARTTINNVVNRYWWRHI